MAIAPPGHRDVPAVLAGHYVQHLAGRTFHDAVLRMAATVAARVASWIVAAALLALTFAVLYYWAPACNIKWHWITPGAAIGVVGWLLASLGFRVYLHYFNTYTATYGSLGAVIILLMWFYITGLMLLVGAEVNSQIEAAAAEKTLQEEPPTSNDMQVRAASGM